MAVLRGLTPSVTGPFRRRLSSSAHSHALRLPNVPLDVHPEVEDALAHNIPVVALETALVTHGLPYPDSLQVPLALEEIVRSTGCIPATIGLIEGRVKIGLERHELGRLAHRQERPAKISRRDIAAAIASGRDGGTTCSATLVFSALAGIKVFATGGLGGVHRGGEKSLDISADLHELTRCPVGLVSAGVKSILDIGRTLEYLETLGVPVLPYGKSREFPAFFSRRSGYKVPWHVEDPQTAAKILYTQAQLGMQNGALIAVPIPEEYEKQGEKIQRIVERAIKESEENGMSKSGNDATPWLLDRIAKLSEGKSLASNIALLKNTALVGGQIAVEHQKLVNEGIYGPSEKTVARQSSGKPARPSSDSESKKARLTHPATANVVVVGSAAIDITAQELPNQNAALAVHSTAPGHVKVSLGGVGRNIAEASHRVMKSKYPELSSVLVSAIGNDVFGRILEDELVEFGMRTDGLIKVDAPSAVCNMVLDSKGTLVGGVADMGITTRMTAEAIIPEIQKHAPSIVVLDGNLPLDTIQALTAHCYDHTVKVLFEPTSTIKSTSILPAIAANLQKDPSRPPVDFCTPNLLELSRLFEAASSEPFSLMDHPVWWSVIDGLGLSSAFNNDIEQLARRQASDEKSGGSLAFLVQDGVIQQAVQLLPFFRHLVIKCGDLGVLVVMRIAPEDASSSEWAQERSNPLQRHVVVATKSGEIIVVQHFPSHHLDVITNVTGAGDSFVGTLLAALAKDLKQQD
ncbi:unnamed protein product [Cyclocybe aegerita]|uniref:Carbohydrate kinase PfkB domain-containing protein n=1 Tax=Cyclocybe aegerita TaxID=1973307 RepID=A0A8S0XDJ5_CYCAE|nr:unnamed protein product [Cyclocybe aegerita]